MARRTNSQPPERPRPELTAPVSDVRSRIEVQVQKGSELLEAPIDSWDSLKAVRATYYTWLEYTQELLRALFTTSEVRDAFAKSVRMIYSLGGTPDLREEIDEFRSDLGAYVRRLESVRDRLDLYEAPATSAAVSPTARDTASSRRVFIVHGRARSPVEACARLLREQGLEPVILDEQPNRGRTIIEKFEGHADVSFAIVAMSGDDIGGLVGTPAAKLSLRARQNVILELGFFVGRLGRHRVAALVAPGVEIPSDIEGVVYIAMDPARDWRLKLAKELRDAGLPVDLNLL